MPIHPLEMLVLRKRLKFNSKQMADHTGVSYAKYRGWENGKKRPEWLLENMRSIYTKFTGKHFG